MSFNGLRLEYTLEGSSNYIAWKDRMEVVLDDNGLKEFIEDEVPKPTDAAHIEAWQKKTTKCQRILLEGMKDHIVSSLHGKTSPYLMWKALTDLFQSKSNQRKLALKDKLRNIKCEKGDNMPTYLTKFTQCWDELGTVGVIVDDEELVSLTLLGLRESWYSYQDSVNSQEKLQDGRDFGRILCKGRSGGIQGTDLHQRHLMKKIALWLPKQRRGRRRVLFSNPILPMMGRRLTNRKCDALVVMRWAIMLQIVHGVNPGRDPGKVLKVRHLLHSLSWISHSLHAWFHPWWEVVGFLTVELLST